MEALVVLFWFFWVTFVIAIFMFGYYAAGLLQELRLIREASVREDCDGDDEEVDRLTHELDAVCTNWDASMEEVQRLRVIARGTSHLGSNDDTANDGVENDNKKIEEDVDLKVIVAHGCDGSPTCGICFPTEE